MMRLLVTGGNGFIGTNFVLSCRTYLQKPYEIFCIDIVPPKIFLEKNEKWLHQNILDQAAMETIFEQVQPNIVINFAAFTNTDESYDLTDYETNTKGAFIVFDLCQKYQTNFLIHTSSQYVNQAAGFPASDLDFAPKTVYGQSKVISEQYLQNGNHSFNWCIIRPTNIWGPYHLRYPFEFWKILKEGKYFHPGKRPVIRSYGFVGNICWQIIELIKQKDHPQVAKNVYYVGDEPMNMYEWANAFSKGIIKKDVRIVPSTFVYALACIGSLLRKCNVKFPITLSRYKSMTTDYPAPMNKTFLQLGAPPYPFQEGVSITVKWLKSFWQNQ